MSAGKAKMKSIRRHLNYANVMSTIAVFLLLAGGTAIAAKQLGKNTVGPKQLKKNSVTAAKIKKGAVTRAKIAAGAIDATKLADGSVNGAKIADGSVGGAEIAVAGSRFSRKVASLGSTALTPYAPGTVYPLGSYTQAADELSQYIAAIDVRFGAACPSPRSVQALLLIDAADPEAPKPENYMGIAVLEENSAGEVVRRLDFVPLIGLGGAGLSRVPPGVATSHKFDVLLSIVSCAGNADVTGGYLDVIGTR